MIDAKKIDNLDSITRAFIVGAEGNLATPWNVGDNTITIGFGYTLIRKGEQWSIPGFLTTDLQAINIALSVMEKGTDLLSCSNFGELINVLS